VVDVSRARLPLWMVPPKGSVDWVDWRDCGAAGVLCMQLALLMALPVVGRSSARKEEETTVSGFRLLKFFLE
jgi:hypothetical protein